MSSRDIGWPTLLAGVSFAVLLSACGASSPPPAPPAAAPPPPTAAHRPAYRAGGDLDPSRAPNATSVFNVSALRAGKHTARLLAAFKHFLPREVSLDEVDWLAIDGPRELDSTTHNVLFVSRPPKELLVVRGLLSDSAVKPPSEPPPKSQLVRVLVRAPSKLVRVPYFRPPPFVEDLALTVEAREDEGADIHLRERCTNTVDAAKAAAALDEMIARVGSKVGREVTHGLLTEGKATTDGDDARLDVTASPEQVDALVELALLLIRGP